MYVRRGVGGVVQDIAAAISRQEGINPAYNNPGGLIAAPGCTGRAPNGIVICPDAATGQAALERQIQIDIDRGQSINELIRSWAPVGCGPMCAGNDPATYAANVARWTGIDPNTPLRQLQTSGATGSWDVGPFDLSSVVDDASAVDWQSLVPWAIGGLLLLLWLRG